MNSFTQLNILQSLIKIELFEHINIPDYVVEQTWFVIYAIYPGAIKPFNAIDMSRVSHLSKSSSSGLELSQNIPYLAVALT